MKLKHRLRNAALFLPTSIYQRVIRRDFIGLYYHVVSDAPLPHLKHLYAFKSPAAFEDDLRYLKSHFNCITYAQLESYQTHGTKLPPKALLLTFDDGLSQCFSTVRPLLLRHQIPCVFFVTTDFLDNRGLAADMKASLCIEKYFSAENEFRQRFSQAYALEFGEDYPAPNAVKDRIKNLVGNNPSKLDALCEWMGIDVQAYLAREKPYLSSEQVKQLNADGFTIGAHSLRHERLSELTPQELENNIVQSCQVVQDLTGAAKIPFAFPFSAEGISRTLLQEIRANHLFVGLYFGGNGIVTDSEAIIPRFCGDSPNGSSPGRSNLKVRIANAYLEALSLKLSKPAAQQRR